MPQIPQPESGGFSAPSLFDRLRRPPSAGRARALRIAAGVVLALLALVALVAGVLAGRARHEAIALGDVVARVAAAREADRGAARLFGKPTLGEEIAGIAAHLPPETKLASAARDLDGGLSIAIDTSDPDVLRDTLRADPWFAAFHERGQAIGADGAIRVSFGRAP